MGRACSGSLMCPCVYVDARGRGEIEGIGVTDGEIEGAGERAARASVQQSHRSRWEGLAGGWEGGRPKPSSAAGRGCFHLQHSLCFTNTASVLGYNLHVTPMSSSYAHDRNIPVTLQESSHNELFRVKQKGKKQKSPPDNTHREQSVTSIRQPMSVQSDSRKTSDR